MVIILQKNNCQSI